VDVGCRFKNERKGCKDVKAFLMSGELYASECSTLGSSEIRIFRSRRGKRVEPSVNHRIISVYYSRGKCSHRTPE
jgi:hypothetical protein